MKQEILIQLIYIINKHKRNRPSNSSLYKPSSYKLCSHSIHMTNQAASTSLNKSAMLNTNSIMSIMNQTQHYHSLADQTLAGNAASELLTNNNNIQHSQQQNEIMSDDEYKLFMLEMKDLHHIMKDMNTIGDERENASEEWWNSLALNIPGPSESSLSSSPKQSSNTNNNNTSISSNNSNTNEGLKINMSLIKAFNDSGTSENLNLNNSNDNINNSSKRDDDSDDEDDEENEDELLTLSSLAKLRKLIPRIPKLIPPDENGAERSSTLNMLNLTSPKKSSNSRGIVSLTSENLLKSPKQQLDSKRTDLSILLDNEPSDHFNVFSLSNSPKKSTTSKRNFDNTLETLSKVYSPKQNNINLETITIPKKEYEDLKTENVILQGRLIQMELIHEKLLQMILNNKSN